MATLARRCFRWPGFRGMTKYLEPIVETKYTESMSIEEFDQMPLWKGQEGSLRGGDYWKIHRGDYHDLLWFEDTDGGRVWEFSAAESGFITEVPDDFEEDDLSSIANYFVMYPWLYLMKLGPESKLWTLDMRTGNVVQQVSAMAFFQEFYCILAWDRNGILIKAYRDDQKTFAYFSRSIEA
jgi:hypothetical protein